VAGNITSDNVGPQHLINIKRLAYVVRKPEEAFEMPLDYNLAPNAPAPAAVGPVDRNAIVSAVERYLASRGMAVSVAAASAPSGPSCGCSHPAPATSPVAGNVTADIVDQFLASRSKSSSGGYS
jgi:acetaldehyde dehydrogenase (acetylating)